VLWHKTASQSAVKSSLTTNETKKDAGTLGAFRNLSPSSASSSSAPDFQATHLNFGDSSKMPNLIQREDDIEHENTADYSQNHGKQKLPSFHRPRPLDNPSNCSLTYQQWIRTRAEQSSIRAFSVNVWPYTRRRIGSAPKCLELLRRRRRFRSSVEPHPQSTLTSHHASRVFLFEPSRTASVCWRFLLGEFVPVDRASFFICW